MRTSGDSPTAAFVFAVCQVGAEGALKAEVLRTHPDWKFAFGRPGFVTWKTPESVSVNLRLGAVFASLSGLSLGPAENASHVLERLRATLGMASSRRCILHVFDRHEPAPPESDGAPPLIERVAAEMWACGPAQLAPQGTLPAPGDWVLDVMVAPNEPLWVGLHVHDPSTVAHDGGRPALLLPHDAPSRAWLKLAQGLRWSGLPLQRDEVVVEIGSAPGGASAALLERGLRVIGVDPGLMAQPVLAHPRFTHLHTTLGELRREALPARVDWLLLDVNLAPQVALHGVRRIVSTLRSTLRGVLFTLKLNDWDMAEQVPALCERVRLMGFDGVRATQLPANRREICVTGQREPVRHRWSPTGKPPRRRAPALHTPA